MSVARRRERIDPKHKRLSIVRQCALLQISRKTACKAFQILECAPGGGQFQASDLTVCWAC